MFQKIDFTKLGGFPLTQNTLLYVQNSYNDVLEALARAIGDYVIISGVTEISPSVFTSGWVTYDNKIVPFAGGELTIINNFVNLVETNTSVTFENSNVFEVTTGYTAIFANTGIPFSTFDSQRLSLTYLKSYIDAVNVTALSSQSTANNALAAANAAQASANAAQATANAALLLAGNGVPSGVILIWRNSVATIPTGFVICDGTNGTPDLRDKFVAGAGGTYAVNAQGGSNTVTLSIGQMPSHNHRFNSNGNRGGGGGGREPYTFGTPGNSLSIDTSWVGGDPTGVPIINGIPQSTSIKTTLPHENRPPYWALCYIMKT